MKDFIADLKTIKWRIYALTSLLGIGIMLSSTLLILTQSFSLFLASLTTGIILSAICLYIGSVKAIENGTWLKRMKLFLRIVLAILGFLGVDVFCVAGISYLPRTDLLGMLTGVGFMFLAIISLGLFGYVTITLSEQSITSCNQTVTSNDNTGNKEES
jgi:hypothetical protein